jgi:hypothetical protein
MFHDERHIRAFLADRFGADLVSDENVAAVLAELAREDTGALAGLITELAATNPAFAEAGAHSGQALWALDPEYDGEPGDPASGWPRRGKGPDAAVAARWVERARDALPAGVPERASAGGILRTLRQIAPAAGASADPEGGQSPASQGAPTPQEAAPEVGQ